MKAWFAVLFGLAFLLILFWLAALGRTNWAQEIKLALLIPAGNSKPEAVPPGPPLRGIVVFTNAQDVVSSGITNFGGLWIDPIPELTDQDRESLDRILQPYWEKEITPQSIQRIRNEIARSFKQRLGRSNLACLYPEQDTSSGVLQLVLQLSSATPIHRPLAKEPVLRGIILLTNAQEVVASRITNFAGLWIDSTPELTEQDRGGLTRLLGSYWDQPLTPELVQDVRVAIAQTLNQPPSGRKFVCTYPDQDASGGVLQFVVQQLSRLQIGAPLLRGIILLTNAQEVVAIGINNFGGLWIDRLPEFAETDGEDLARVLQPYWTQPVTPELVQEIRAEIARYLQGRFAVREATCNVQEQNISGGVVQFVIQVPLRGGEAFQMAAPEPMTPPVRSPVESSSRSRFLAQSKKSPFRWLDVKLVEAGLGLEAEGESETRKLSETGTAWKRSYIYIAPMLELGVQGSVYHPNLLQFGLKAADGVSWQEQYLSETTGASPAGTESKTDFLQRYHVNVAILKEKPYATTLFADKDHNFRQFDFFNRATVDSQRYGGRAGLSDGPLPFNVNVIHLDEEVTGFTRPGSLDETTVNFDMRNERARNARTTLSYMLDNYDRRELDIPEQRGTYHSANLSDFENWGENDRYKLNSALFYSRLDEALVPTRSLMITEHAGIDITKHLQNYYDYNFDDRSSGSSDSQGHSGQASLRHQLADRLTSGLDVHDQVFDSSSPGTTVSGTRYGLGFGSTYATPLGKWVDASLGYNGRYDQEERETTGQTIQIIGESHTLNDGVVIFLAQPLVVASSIRVTDANGRQFQLDFDYLVINHGDLTEIRRAPGTPLIPNGGIILVDYQAIIQPTASFSTLAHQIHIRFDFFNRMFGVYGRVNLVDNYGGESLILQNISDKVVGADFGWRWVRAGAEYEIYDSNLAPYKTKHVFEAFSFNLNQESTFSIDLDQAWTSFEDDGRHRTSYSFIGRYNNHFTPHLFWNLEGGWRIERGQGFDQSLAVCRTGLEYVRGKLACKLGYDFQDQDFLGELRVKHFFYLQAKRSF